MKQFREHKNEFGENKASWMMRRSVKQMANRMDNATPMRLFTSYYTLSLTERERKKKKITQVYKLKSHVSSSLPLYPHKITCKFCYCWCCFVLGWLIK